MSRRKSTARAKLKAASQERIHLWKQHFENLLGKPPKVTDDPFTKIICNQLDIKLGQFTLEELEIKNRKAAEKYRRQGNLTRYCSDTVTPYITIIQ